jgi:glycerol-3-phosphate acyltransferase PlsY
MKGFGPVFMVGVATRVIGDGAPALMYQASWLAVTFACILGHMFPVWLKFRGGKGVATGLGVVCGFWPYLTLAGVAAFGVWIAITLITRYVSLASIVAAIMFPIFCVGINWMRLGSLGELVQLWPMGVFALALPTLIVYSHRSNIGRLLAGTENKIGRSKTD